MSFVKLYSNTFRLYLSYITYTNKYVAAVMKFVYLMWTETFAVTCHYEGSVDKTTTL